MLSDRGNWRIEETLSEMFMCCIV